MIPCLRMLSISRTFFKEIKRGKFGLVQNFRSKCSTPLKFPTPASEHLKKEKDILDARSLDMCYESAAPACVDSASSSSRSKSPRAKSIEGSKLVIPPSRFSDKFVDTADYHLSEAMIHIKEANRLVDEAKLAAANSVKQSPRESSLFSVFNVFGNALSESILGRATRNALSTANSLDSVPSNDVLLERAEKRDELERRGSSKFTAVIVEPTTAMKLGAVCRVRVIESIDEASLLHSSQSSGSTRVDAEAGSDGSSSSFSSIATFGLPPCVPSSSETLASSTHVSPGLPSSNAQECNPNDQVPPPDARVLSDPSLSLFPWPDHPMHTKLADSKPLSSPPTPPKSQF